MFFDAADFETERVVQCEERGIHMVFNSYPQPYDERMQRLECCKDPETRIFFTNIKRPSWDSGDNLCSARALVVAVAHCQKNGSHEMMKRYNNIRLSELLSKKHSNLQKSEAQLLCRRAKVNLENGGPIDDVVSFRTFLVDYTKTVSILLY